MCLHEYAYLHTHAYTTRSLASPPLPHKENVCWKGGSEKLELWSWSKLKLHEQLLLLTFHLFRAGLGSMKHGQRGAQETSSLDVVSVLLALLHCLALKLGSQPSVSGRNRWGGICLSSRARPPWQRLSASSKQFLQCWQWVRLTRQRQKSVQSHRI